MKVLVMVYLDIPSEIAKELEQAAFVVIVTLSSERNLCSWGYAFIVNI